MKNPRKLNRAIYIKRYGEAAEYLIEKRNKGYSELPWNRAYSNIHQRCNSEKDGRYKAYGGRGIKCLLKPTDLKMAFMRDKAWLLKTPSVDRINPMGHYEPGNIRWIEWRENSRLRLFADAVTGQQFKKFKATIIDFGKEYGWPDWAFKKALVRVKNELAPGLNGEDRNKGICAP